MKILLSLNRDALKRHDIKLRRYGEIIKNGIERRLKCQVLVMVDSLGKECNNFKCQILLENHESDLKAKATVSQVVNMVMGY